MQINSSHIISFKVASYSACYLTNGDYIGYFTWETYAWKQSDCGGEEVELFPVLIQIVEDALFSYEMLPCKLPEFSMFCKKKISLHVSMPHKKVQAISTREVTCTFF